MSRKYELPFTMKLPKKLAADLEHAATILQLPRSILIRHALECAIRAAEKYQLASSLES